MTVWTISPRLTWPQKSLLVSSNAPRSSWSIARGLARDSRNKSMLIRRKFIKNCRGKWWYGCHHYNLHKILTNQCHVDAEHAEEISYGAKSGKTFFRLDLIHFQILLYIFHASQCTAFRCRYCSHLYLMSTSKARAFESNLWKVRFVFLSISKKKTHRNI